MFGASYNKNAEWRRHARRSENETVADLEQQIAALTAEQKRLRALRADIVRRVSQRMQYKRIRLCGKS